MKTYGLYGLCGYDTFEGEYYGLDGEFETEEEARKAARARMDYLNETQPVSSSGGQGFGGIQDKVYIVHPDGSKHQFIG